MRLNACAPKRRAHVAIIALLAGAALAVALSLPTAASAKVMPPAGGGTTVANGAGTTTGGNAPTGGGSAATTDNSSLPAIDAQDPFCTTGLTAQQEQNCRVSGSVAEPYPISNYGIDYANPPTGLSQLSPGDWFDTLLGEICSVVWTVWLYAIRGVLALLNWAFTLRLVHDAMGSVEQGLGILHGQVFGVSWLEAAIAVAGLWAIWHGLVRRKTIETFGGLAVTVALMLVSLLLIARPDATVGKLATFSDQASLAALSGASSASVAQPTQGFASAEGDLFSSLVMRPWCALEFGDVNYCTQPRDGTTVADMWLAFGPMGPGRQGLYNLATTGNITQYGGIFGTVQKDLGLIQTPPVITEAQACSSDPSGDQCQALKQAEALNCYRGNAGSGSSCAFSSSQANKVSMQSGGNALTRAALLALIVVGILGALCLLLYLAIHLVFAAIATLILLLGAPVMLLVPAFGESGRMTSIAYFKRLIGAIVTKFVFAVLLALVVLMATTINGLNLGWFSVWMLNIVFWWGVLIKRKQFIGFLTLDKRAGDAGLAVAGDGTQNPFRLLNLYYGWRMLQSGARAVRGLGALPRATRRHALERRTADSLALRDQYQGEMAGRAARAIGMVDNERTGDAQGVVNAYNQRLGDIAAVRGRQQPLREAILADTEALRATPRGTPRYQSLQKRRKRFQTQLDAMQLTEDGLQNQQRAAQPDYNRATAWLRTASEGNRAEDPRELRRELDQRQADVAPGITFPSLSAADRPRLERTLRWAGVDPTGFFAMAPAAQGPALATARAVWERDSQLATRLNDPRAAEGLPDTRAEVKRGMQEAGTRGRWREVHARSAEHARAQQAQRRVFRARPRR